MEVQLQTQRPNGMSRPVKADSLDDPHMSIFDSNKYILKLPMTKKVGMPNGQVRWEKTETDYLPVAARIAWFRREHSLGSIVTEVEQLVEKAVAMKATVKDMLRVVIAIAKERDRDRVSGLHRESRNRSTRQAPEDDEADLLADAPVVKQMAVN